MNIPLELSKTIKLQDHKITVYIAGKVTGLTYKEVYAKFRAKQLELEAQGFQVLNPCEIIAEDCEWYQAMRTAITLLCTSEYICLLPCWKKSRGARIERLLAWVLNIQNIDK